MGIWPREPSISMRQTFVILLIISSSEECTPHLPATGEDWILAFPASLAATGPAYESGLVSGTPSPKTLKLVM